MNRVQITMKRLAAGSFGLILAACAAVPPEVPEPEPPRDWELYPSKRAWTSARAVDALMARIVPTDRLLAIESVTCPPAHDQIQPIIGIG